MEFGRYELLLVEDSPDDAELVQDLMSVPAIFGATYSITHVEDLGAAIDLLNDLRFDAILLDLNLPDSNDLTGLHRLYELTPETPIVLLSARSDARLILQAVQNGAQDFLIKHELNVPLLHRVIHYAIERKRIEAQIRHVATHDPLTELPNRALLYDRLEGVAKRSIRFQHGRPEDKWKAAIMIMDLDNFKQVNDRYGHAVGDSVLRHVAQQLKSCLRESDTLARFGGDEFVLLVEGISGREDVEVILPKLIEAVDSPIEQVFEPASFKLSIGISIFPDDAEDIDTLLRYADTAMYAAKQMHDPYRYYEAPPDSRPAEDLSKSVLLSEDS